MTTLTAEDQRALEALRRAVTDALELKRRLGQYAVIWRNGRVESIVPDEKEAVERLDPGKPGA